MTERGLSEAIGVSRSPIRAALKVLESKKVVSFIQGKGYFLKQVGPKLGKIVINAARPDDEALYEKILRHRFLGQLPERVSEADFMRRYQVTRSALIKALMRMYQEGLIERSQGHGWLFAEFLGSEETYYASYEYRLAIEPMAILSANFKVDIQKTQSCLEKHRELLDRIENDYDRLTGAEQFDLDAELHEMIVSFSANQFFENAIKHQNRLRRLVEYESFHKHERMKDSCEEHIKILEALISGQIEWASKLMARHLDLAGHSVKAFEEPLEV